MWNPCHRSLIGSSISSPRKRNITHLAEKRQNDRNFGIGRQHGDPIAVFASTWNDQWPWDRGLNFESGRYLNRGCSMEKESPVIYAVYNLSRHSPFRLGEDRTGSEPRPQVFLYKIPRLLEYGADMSGMCNSSSQDSQWYVYSQWYSDMWRHNYWLKVQQLGLFFEFRDGGGVRNRRSWSLEVSICHDWLPMLVAMILERDPNTTRHLMTQGKQIQKSLAFFLF